MKIRQVVEALERFAPLPLQESWDNSGLQIGLTEADVSGVLLCLDVTEQIIDEAVRRGCNMVVSHHPLLFRGLKQVSDLTDVQRTVRSAIRHDVCVVSMHTCLDNAHGGVNTRIAERLAMPLKEGEQPQIAEMGGDTKPGQWVMLTLRQPMAARNFVLHVKRQLEAESAMCNELLRRPVTRVAICGGAGDFLLDEAVAHGADAFVTGEMHYHQYFGYEQKLQICVVGHYESEHFTTTLLQDIISRECPEVTTCIAEANTNPILYL